MSAKRPVAARPVLVYSRPVPRRDATDPAGGQRDDERAALWLYAWSHDALRPTGELLAARLTSRAAPLPLPQRDDVRACALHERVARLAAIVLLSISSRAGTAFHVLTDAWS
jgi:hypothetical protein